MSSRTLVVLLCVWTFAACGKESGGASAASPTGTAAGEGTDDNLFGRPRPVAPTAPSTGTPAANPESPPAPPTATAPNPAASSAPAAAVTRPATPTTRADGKQAFPIPGAMGGAPTPAAPGGTTVGIPGLPGGVELPAGLPPEATTMVNQMMGDMLSGGMQELEERPGLPNWRKLAALLPDQLGEFVAQGPANGASAMVLGMSTTTAMRNYRAPDGRTAEITLAGGDVAQLSAMEFAFPLPDEATPEHVWRIIQVAGKPAAVEWSKDGGQAEARTLVAEKFSVMVTVHQATGVDAAQTLLQALDLVALARIP